MTRDKVNHQLNTSWELPETVHRLREIVGEVEEFIPGEKTKDLMYELVEIVMECGERVHDLESKIMSGSPIETNKQHEERIRIHGMKCLRRSS